MFLFLVEVGDAFLAILGALRVPLGSAASSVASHAFSYRECAAVCLLTCWRWHVSRLPTCRGAGRLAPGIVRLMLPYRACCCADGLVPGAWGTGCLAPGIVPSLLRLAPSIARMMLLHRSYCCADGLVPRAWKCIHVLNFIP
ncbi:hypothetical protein HAX54_018341 [Datura stramonium]|uniref:Secreted protein n=1 Tax=Datura stramonium TaxID=4076 RepID=A0ABS8UPY9_DATST|nr:hypothetical protein [Datura stramonium]